MRRIVRWRVAHFRSWRASFWIVVVYFELWGCCMAEPRSLPEGLVNGFKREEPATVCLYIVVEAFDFWGGILQRPKLRLSESSASPGSVFIGFGV
jgi:hypothetical protein